MDGPASRTRFASPGTRVSRSRTTSSTVAPVASIVRSAPGNSPARLRGRWTTAGRTASLNGDCLDAPDRRQVVSDPAPRPTLVRGRIELPGARAEVHAHRVERVVRHGLAQHADVRV